MRQKKRLKKKGTAEKVWGLGFPRDEAEEKGHCREGLGFRVSTRWGWRKRALQSGVLKALIPQP
jgi:hypothetical protein